MGRTSGESVIRSEWKRKEGWGPPTWLTPTLSSPNGADHSLSSSWATIRRLNSSLKRAGEGRYFRVKL